MDSLHALPSSSCCCKAALRGASSLSTPSAARPLAAPLCAPPFLTLSAPSLQRPSRAIRSRGRSSFSMAARASVGLLETLQSQVNTKGVKIEEGEGGLPKLVLTDSMGSQAEIYIFGACVTSWRLSNGKDMLYVRPDALFNGQKPISGGIPHCFPQFGPGPIQQHGFARNLPWSIASSENVEGNPSVVFELKDNKYTRDMWNYGFHATYKVSLEPNKFSTALVVKNTEDKPFSFTTALHTYFRASAADVVVKGLKGCKTLNKVPDPVNPKAGVEDREDVNFPGFVDCVYLNTPQELLLTNGLGDVLSISNKNWSDAVLWNPHTNAPGNIHNDFVCVENAQIEPVFLEPGKEWVAEQVLKVC